jgi:hypothetical protein
VRQKVFLNPVIPENLVAGSVRRIGVIEDGSDGDGRTA